MKKIILGIIVSVFIYAVFFLGENTATKPNEKTKLAGDSKQEVLGAQTPALSGDLNLPAYEPASTSTPEPARPNNNAEAKAEPIKPPAITIEQPASKTKIVAQPPIAPKAPRKQIIRGIITEEEGLIPYEYTIKVRVPVRFEIDPKDDIEGCMSTIMVYGLYDEPFLIKAGKKIIMEFTPEQTGEYYIVCVMGVDWGKITVVE